MSRVLNLTFHGVGEPGPGIDAAERAVWVSTGAFLGVLDAVRPRESVRITFDDGNLSDYTIALPALLERGMTASFFVVAGRLGAEGYLDAPHLLEMSAAGMEIGSHGMWHRPWRRLSDADLNEEIGQARYALEEVLGVPVSRAACPFGAYERRTLAMLRRAGFERVFTSDGGYARTRSWLQTRNTVVNGSETAAIDGGRPATAALAQRAKTLVKRWR